MTSPLFLGLEHLKDVRYELGHFVQWKLLGLNLGVPPQLLEAIENDYRSTADRLTQVLVRWFRREHDIGKYGLPSWAQLANALEPIDVSLAQTIKEEYPSSFQSELPKAKVQC